MEGSLEFKVSHFTWWYRVVGVHLFSYLKKLNIYLLDLFSIKNCFTTLFYPWKRDLINTEGLSIQDRFQVLALNMTSRLVGFIIKISTILTFSIIFVIIQLFSLFSLIFWISYPLVLILLFIYGLRLFIQ